MLDDFFGNLLYNLGYYGSFLIAFVALVLYAFVLFGTNWISKGMGKLFFCIICLVVHILCMKEMFSGTVSALHLIMILAAAITAMCISDYDGFFSVISGRKSADYDDDDDLDFLPKKSTQSKNTYSSSSNGYVQSSKADKSVNPYPMESPMDNKVLGVYDKISELCAFCFLHIIPNFVNVEEIQMYIGYSDTDNRCAVTLSWQTNYYSLDESIKKTGYSLPEDCKFSDYSGLLTFTKIINSKKSADYLRNTPETIVVSEIKRIGPSNFCGVTVNCSVKRTKLGYDIKMRV